MPTYNIYCDESCHLAHDRQPVMVLGAVWCSAGATRTANRAISDIKRRHGMNGAQELKWIKLSPARLELHLDVVECFLASDELHFRCLVADKTRLRHSALAQTHDDWYFKMYFEMLRTLLASDAAYNIYLDVKDTRSAQKSAHLHDVLCSDQGDSCRRVVQRVQHVRSHEIQLMQLTDILVGAVSYANRRARTSQAKMAIIDRLRDRLGFSLEESTPLQELKFNLSRWPGREG